MRPDATIGAAKIGARRVADHRNAPVQAEAATMPDFNPEPIHTTSAATTGDVYGAFPFKSPATHGMPSEECHTSVSVQLAPLTLNALMP